MGSIENCPVMHAGRKEQHTGTPANQTWWPERLNLHQLRGFPSEPNPLGADFDYRAAFEALDLDAVCADLNALMTDSQPWWPADYGHYGPFFIRMAWHSAGTYRVFDGRGGAAEGMQRFAPLNSWPDNGNLDKARRLLWPIKQKYGASLSWADLMILAGNVALESMGLKTAGFSGGREDAWGPDEDVYWGPESDWLANERYSGERDLAKPLGAVQMGLIYVNPEGPDGNPDPLASAVDIRETFARMGMNDEETVALTAGGHTFGKAHGAGDPDAHVGAEPEAAPVEQQGLGWHNTLGEGHGISTITSGIEGAWTTDPTVWDNGYFDALLGYEWTLTTGPGGAQQWTPVDSQASKTVPDAHDPQRRHAPMMTTADMAMKLDPAYAKISQRFHDNPDEFARVFAEAWYKLTHRDMGPHTRALGSLAPTAARIWQDPIPVGTQPALTSEDVNTLKQAIQTSSLTPTQLVKTAWAAASTYRNSDKRGGANGGRIRLAPQKDWAVNEPELLARVLEQLEHLRSDFCSQSEGKSVSLADTIVLGGIVGVEQAAAAAGHQITLSFTPGRMDALEEDTDIASFEALEPSADAFRNYFNDTSGLTEEQCLVDRAQLLTLSVSQMSALLGGMRAMGVTVGGTHRGVFTHRTGALSNDFFVNLLDMQTVWAADETGGGYTGSARDTGEEKWTASRVDLVFGANPELRAIAEVFASSDGEAVFIKQFVSAWTKVMDLDRFDMS